MAPIDVLVEHAQLVVRMSTLESTITAHRALGCMDAAVLEKNVKELEQAKIDIVALRLGHDLPYTL